MIIFVNIVVLSIYKALDCYIMNYSLRLKIPNKEISYFIYYK